MPGVDTNVVVRLLTADEPRQYQRAKALFAGPDVWLGKTVLIETFWVLREVYDLGTADIMAAIRNLLSLPNVDVEQEALVRRALALTETGMDFADAVHVLSAAPRSFASFDRRLVNRAQRAGLDAVST